MKHVFRIIAGGALGLTWATYGMSILTWGFWVSWVLIFAICLWDEL
jgi:hypothetical protein